MIMQITNIHPIQYSQHIKKQDKQLCFGQYVSKLGRSIDNVLSAKDPSPDSLTNLYEELFKFVQKPGFRSKLKGKGFYSYVYGIDDKYVLKIGKCKCIEPEPNIELREPIFPELKTYYGDALIISGDLKILRNVSSNKKTLSAGVPPEIMEKTLIPRKNTSSGNTQYNMCFADYEHGNEVLKHYNEVYLPTFANLPQASFNKLANDLALLNRKGFNYHGFSIDTNNPNNIVLVGKSSLRIVDDIDIVEKRKPNSIAGLLNMLLVKANFNTELPLPTNISTLSLRFQLLKKIILAGEKYDLPLTCYNVQDKNIWYHACYGLKDSGLNVIENIQKMRDNIPDKKQRVIEVEKYLNKLGEELERNSNQ